MRINLMTTALALTLVGPGLALAQQSGTTETTPPPAAASPGMGTAPTTGGMGAAAGPSDMGTTMGQTGTPTTAPSPSWYADVQSDEIIGQTVYGSNGEEIGEVDNVVINQQGKQAAAVIGVGGFLGIGERDVTIPLDNLQRGQDNRLTTSMTKDAIGALSEYQEGGDWMALGAGRTVGQGMGE